MFRGTFDVKDNYQLTKEFVFLAARIRVNRVVKRKGNKKSLTLWQLYDSDILTVLF